MLILSIDTSADICSVSLCRSETELSTLRFRHERQLSERLPGIVTFLLKDRGMTLTDVEAFAVGLGPGSFTGVRVGVTLAKTWSQVLGRPIAGISSLDALAAAVPPVPGGIVAAVAPTRRTEAVVSFYRAGETESSVAASVVPHEGTVAAAAAAFPDSRGPIFLAGEIATAVAATNPALPGERTLIVLPLSPDAAIIARLAARRLANGDSDDPLQLSPLYVTPPPVRGPDGQLLTLV